MSKKDPKNPATTSFAYDTMLPRWMKISTLLGGTESMRAAGAEYLPQHPAESDRAYQERLKVTTLLNMVDITLTSLVSRPFKSPIKIGDKVPEAIRGMLDDIDLQGTSLDRFARNWFREGVAKGFSIALAEFPRVMPKEDGSPRTAADDLEENLRPYLVHIPPEHCLSMSAEVLNGREVLKELRIYEQKTVQVGFAERVKEYIRVLRVGMVQIWERQEKPKKKDEEWKLVDEYEYDLSFIPAVVFYSDRQGLGLSKPPLTDLADLNIRHWQSTSDQITVLTVARFPMLAVSGASDDDDVTVGPHQVQSVPDPAGRFYYVEHTGKAIGAGRQDLLDLEEVMAQQGATFLRKKTGGATATARALDAVETTSALQDMAMSFQDCLNQIMFFFGLWMKIDDAGQFGIETDFTMTDQDEKGLDALVKARAAKDISRVDFLLGLQRYGVLPENFDIEGTVKDLASEKDFMPQPTTKPAGGGA